MSRPEDIPKDVWDYAEIALKFVPSGDDNAQIAAVARAILAERERCGKICDAFIEAYDEEIASIGLVQTRRGSPAKYAVKCIADAIRKGGE